MLMCLPPRPKISRAGLKAFERDSDHVVTFLRERFKTVVVAEGARGDDVTKVKRESVGKAYQSWWEERAEDHGLRSSVKILPGNYKKLYIRVADGMGTALKKKKFKGLSTLCFVGLKPLSEVEQ